MNETEIQGMDQDTAVVLFLDLVEFGYAVALKHRDGNYRLEIPVRLIGDRAYEKEDEIVVFIRSRGREAVQTRDTLTIV